VRGTWSNVIIDGSRDEEDIKPADPDCGFVELANGHLRTFRITGYGDGDEGCPVLRGNGSVADGSIVAGARERHQHHARGYGTRGCFIRVDGEAGGQRVSGGLPLAIDTARWQPHRRQVSTTRQPQQAAAYMICCHRLAID
jgi:hypothetical protein